MCCEAAKINWNVFAVSRYEANSYTTSSKGKKQKGNSSYTTDTVVA
jgi:hypothetical protein